MTQDPLAQRLWLAAHTDVGLLTKLRVSYRGRFDVLDALWWRFRPLTPTESGVADPAVDLAELQAHVYSRECLDDPVIDVYDPVSGQTVRATEPEHRLRAVSEQLKQDSVALDALLERMRDWFPESRGALAPSKPVEQVESVESSPSTTPDVTAAAAEPVPRTRRGRPLLFGSGLVVGAVVGVLVTISSVPVTNSVGHGDAANAADGDPEYVEIASAGGEPAAIADVLQIFSEDADWGDAGPPNLGPEFQPDTIRSVIGPAPANVGFGVYVAQRGSAEYCIIVQDADLSGSTACATRRTIATSGLQLRALVWSPREPATKSGLLQVYVTWTRTGAIVAGTAPRRAGSTAPYTGSSPAQDPATFTPATQAPGADGRTVPCGPNLRMALC